MQLILTHENADFDALASLLGAALIYPTAKAVIPRTINQNGLDFLTLYWGELPFFDHREVPGETVSQIILVDTYTLPAPNQRRANLPITIIDHHKPPETLPDNYEATFVETGANATYFVENLQAAHHRLSTIQATLLLLGIYEDSGSLTYGSTTARDIRAAAWLLEQGAELDILRDFLHHRLNPVQRELYQLITNQVEFHTIKGNQIILSAVSTAERVAEISNVAHQLRDLYDFDGLFLLVQQNDLAVPYIQLIARSTADTIPAGQIAERFGGGGHPRAAAAHLRDQALPTVRQQLLQVLEELVQPMTTVRQIMSFTVRTLSAEQTIGEAADMARRYGFEGYPVLRQNQVIGVLTRREIDKAVHHNLQGAAVTQFMHAGQIYVSPEDTVEQLQQVMLSHQLGQIPVVEADRIIGVVTRTDLINLIGKKAPTIGSTLNLAEPLQNQLPTALHDLLEAAGREAASLDSSLYIVGGVVRDLILNRPISDVDLVVEGDGIALGKAMQKKYGGHLHTHSRFGTANWITKSAVSGVERLDFVTARTEFYRHPSALPDVEPSSIKQDLHRRDFTINTLALSLDPHRFGDVLDFYGGFQDLQDQQIRVLHSLSFVEDPTRILRAVRLEQRLQFQISPRTATYLHDALDILNRVSPKRLYTEITHIFQEEYPEKIILRLDDLTILPAILPDLQADSWFAERAQQLRTGLADTPWASAVPGLEHYLGLLTFPLSPEGAAEFISRLELSGNLTNVLRQIQRIKAGAAAIRQSQTASQLYGLLKAYSDEALLVCWLAFDDARLREQLVYYSRDLRQMKPTINGTYLIEHFALKPSPQFQEILTMLQDAYLDGHISTLAEEHQYVAAYLKSTESHLEAD